MRGNSLIRICILGLLTIVCSACEDGRNTIYRTGKIALFYATISDYCTPNRSYCDYCKKEGNEFVYGIEVVEDSCASVCDVLYESVNAEKYFEFQATYGDYPKRPMTLEDWEPDGWKSLEPYCVIVADLVKVEIVAIDDWNENYPKGSLLNTLFELRYSSPNNYIKSGFTTDKRETFVCDVDDIPSNPIELLCCNTVTILATTELPTAERPNVNVKYYFSNGEILECQTERGSK